LFAYLRSRLIQLNETHDVIDCAQTTHATHPVTLHAGVIIDTVGGVSADVVWRSIKMTLSRGKKYD